MDSQLAIVESYAMNSYGLSLTCMIRILPEYRQGVRMHKALWELIRSSELVMDHPAFFAIGFAIIE